MGLLERALAGLGKGLADSGEMNLKAQIEELRMNRLAELQEARDSRKYERERTDKLSDFERQKAWDLEKMGVEYGYKAQLKGIGLRGRGGGGGGGDGGEAPLLDTDGNPVVDPDTQEPIMVPRSGGSGGGGGGGRRGSGRSGKSGGSGGDAASAYNLGTDPETGAAVSINKVTGAARPVTMRTPGEEFKPDTFGIADEQNLKQQNEAAQIEAAKRDGRPVNTAPGYRADDKVRVLKAEDKDKGEDRAASDAMTERRELFKLYAEDTKDALPGKAPKFMDWLKAKGYPAPAGLLAGELSPRAEMRNAEPKSQTPTRSATPSRSEQGRRALAPPAPGEVRETKKGRFRFLGGDVNDPKSWVKVD